ncbi:hypothetical protein B0H67DRAFT_574480 [Lasiosphaeris hirsuta]|uniref:Uncharacterized protein n=1 Tax=Lasiosphaeris hirsuta TaxID=260670 RepID=A0AA40DXD5_9PEZI|nr:hypothetical protein B0H67DRAFT_574480 [Lasiosphaeris hirsuta]
MSYEKAPGRLWLHRSAFQAPPAPMRFCKPCIRDGKSVLASCLPAVAWEWMAAGWLPPVHSCLTSPEASRMGVRFNSSRFRPAPLLSVLCKTGSQSCLAVDTQEDSRARKQRNKRPKGKNRDVNWSTCPSSPLGCPNPGSAWVAAKWLGCHCACHCSAAESGCRATFFFSLACNLDTQPSAQSVLPSPPIHPPSPLRLSSPAAPPDTQQSTSEHDPVEALPKAPTIHSLPSHHTCKGLADLT